MLWKRKREWQRQIAIRTKWEGDLHQNNTRDANCKKLGLSYEVSNSLSFRASSLQNYRCYEFQTNISTVCILINLNLLLNTLVVAFSTFLTNSFDFNINELLIRDFGVRHSLLASVLENCGLMWIVSKIWVVQTSLPLSLFRAYSGK